MPTPTGLPTKGDRLLHRDSGIFFTVVKREGSGVVFSIIAKREDGNDANGNHAAGYPRDHIRINEFPWYIQQGIFKWVD